MTADARLLADGRRPLTLGLVLVVTGTAFEALAVAAILPVVARELSGIGLYGWVFSGYMLANLVGIAVAGPLGDRLGPSRPFALGLVLFGAGLLVAGIAPSMPVLVAGRVVQGAGGGAILATAYLLIGVAYPDAARARLFAVLSTAWVIPGVTGPALAGALGDAFGWRSVFLLLMPLVPLAGLLTLPALHRLDIAPDPAQAGPSVLLPVRLAGGAALVLAGLASRDPAVAVLLVLAGGSVGLPALTRLLPAGTLRLEAGLPAAVAVRGLTAFAFFGAEAFLPLALTSVKGLSTPVAGLVLTVAALTWTVGAWLQAQQGARWGRRRTAALGLACVAAGVVGALLLLHPRVPPAVGILAWAVAGLGMGLAYSVSSLVVLGEAPPGQVGTASAGLQLADTLGVALGAGLGGALLASAVAAGWTHRTGIALAVWPALLAAAVALLASRRLPSRLAHDRAGGDEVGEQSPVGRRHG